MGLAFLRGFHPGRKRIRKQGGGLEWPSLRLHAPLGRRLRAGAVQGSGRGRRASRPYAAPAFGRRLAPSPRSRRRRRPRDAPVRQTLAISPKRALLATPVLQLNNDQSTNSTSSTSSILFSWWQSPFSRGQAHAHHRRHGLHVWAIR